MSDREPSKAAPIAIGVAVGAVLGGLILWCIGSALSPVPAPAAARVEPAVAGPAASPPTESAAEPVAATESAEAAPAAEPGPPEEPPAEQLAASTTLPPAQVQEIRNKLRQIALGFLNYESQNRSLPPGGGPRANVALSWRVYLLPYLDEQTLFERFRLDEPWNSPHNLQLLPYMPDAYRTGNDEDKTRFLAFTGEGTAFRPDQPFALRRATDGLSKTVLTVYAGAGNAALWTQPDDLAFDPAHPLAEVGPVNERIEAVLMDGKLLSLPAAVDPATFCALVTPAGNELIDGRVFLESRRVLETLLIEIPVWPATPKADVQNGLKQVVLAAHMHEQAMGQFPAAATFRVIDGTPGPAISWRTMVLPFMDEQSLFRRYETAQPWDGEANRALLTNRPMAYAHADQDDVEHTRLQVFTGEGTPFGPPLAERTGAEAPRGPQSRAIADGTSLTILAVEAGDDRRVFWTEPVDLIFDGNQPAASVGAIDPAGIPAAMFDGSVRIIAPDVDPEVFKGMVLSGDGK